MSNFTSMGMKRLGLCAIHLMPSLVTSLKKGRGITFLCNEYLEFHGVNAAGAWCCPTYAIFIEDVEKRAEVYLCYKMRNLTFMGIKGPGRGVIQIMPSSVTTLKKEQKYTFAVQRLP
jgi:hypothetical protein